MPWSARIYFVGMKAALSYFFSSSHNFDICPESFITKIYLTNISQFSLFPCRIGNSPRPILANNIQQPRITQKIFRKKSYLQHLFSLLIMLAFKTWLFNKKLFTPEDIKHNPELASFSPLMLCSKLTEVKMRSRVPTFSLWQNSLTFPWLFQYFFSFFPDLY